MTITDKKEFQSMLNDVKDHINEVRALENKAILKELSDIKELQRYSNGTQNKHSELISELQRSLPHTIEACPQNERISAMWDDRIAKKGISGWKTAALTAFGIIIGAAVGIAGVVIAFLN